MKEPMSCILSGPFNDLNVKCTIDSVYNMGTELVINVTLLNAERHNILWFPASADMCAYVENSVAINIYVELFVLYVMWLHASSACLLNESCCVIDGILIHYV